MFKIYAGWQYKPVPVEKCSNSHFNACRVFLQLK